MFLFFFGNAYVGTISKLLFLSKQNMEIFVTNLVESEAHFLNCISFTIKIFLDSR